MGLRQSERVGDAMTERTVEPATPWWPINDAIERCRGMLDPSLVVDWENCPAQCSADLATIARYFVNSPDLAALRRDAERWRKFALCQHLNEESVEAAKNIIGDCPMEVLEMVSILMGLDISTHDFAGGLAAAGFISRTEEAMRRAGNYRDSKNALVEVWGEPEDDGSDDAAIDNLT